VVVVLVDVLVVVVVVGGTVVVVVVVTSGQPVNPVVVIASNVPPGLNVINEVTIHVNPSNVVTLSLRAKLPAG
jgi:hypothetical protein